MGIVLIGAFRRFRILCFLFGLMLAPLAVSQHQTGVSGESTPPRMVEVGVWLSGVHDMNFMRGSYNATFYVWWISDDPNFEPFSSLQVLNGWTWSERAVNRQTLADGRHYVAGFLDMTISHPWDLRFFPFDRQRLEVVIETPYEADELQFRPQVEQSRVSEFAQVPGFRIDGMQLRAFNATYDTDFGVRNTSGSQFSRLSIGIDLVRDGGRTILALLVGFAVANIIALLTYAIDRSLLASRLGLVGGAVFAAIGNMFLLNSHIPPASGSIIIDRIAIGTFAVILFSLVNAIVIDRLMRHDRERWAVALDRTIAGMLSVAALIYYAMTLNLS